MHTLNLTLDTRALNRLKAGLRRATPGLKSSHRCEALARGVGFPTHASLLARLKEGPVRIALNAAAFCAFLASREAPFPASALVRAAGNAIVAGVLDGDERLHLWGWGRGPRERLGDGRWETPEERESRVVGYRAALLSSESVDQVLRAIAFLSQVPATKTVRPDTDSYRLKHIAEKFPCEFPDGETLGPAYVANGALIVAAAHLGFRYQTGQGPTGADWPNVTFNMSQAHLDALDIAIRPDGARAQSQRRREQSKALRSQYRAL